jgi:subtilisin family serine protease
MSRVSAAIARVVSDGRVTAAEWSEALKPQVDPLPRKASMDARLLLDLWASQTTTLNAGARRGIAEALGAFGYPVPLEEVTDPELGTPPAQLSAAALRAENVTEPDVELERLLVAVGRTDAELTVAAVDAGYDITHPALDGKLWQNPGEIPANGLDDDGNGFIDDVHGWDFVDEDASIHGIFHGSHVLSIGARGTARLNGIAAIGLKPLQASLQNMLEAMEYACQNGARVVNLSFVVTGAAGVSAMKELMARYPDVLFTKSADNQAAQLGTGTYASDRFLSANLLDNMLVVAASGPGGSFVSNTNYGTPFVEVAARGGNVYAAVPRGLYKAYTGTSMAAPMAMNTAAKCLLISPSLKPQEVKRILTSTGDRYPHWEGRSVGGVVNAERAMRLAAVIDLVRNGATLEDAANQLQLTGAERERVIALARSF